MSTKPLPPPPPASSCTHTHTSPAFTPEAIGHLRKLLTQTVEGERLDTQWVNHLERALLDLAEASNKAQWLFGLRNKRRHHWPYSPIRNLEDNKNSSIDKSNDESNDQEKNTPVMTDHDLTRQALVYLDTLISSNHTCDYEYSRLLITLAPPSSAIPFPDLGIDFDLRPHRETCTFQPGVFNLPFFTPSELAPRRGNGGTILCGLQDCKAEISIDGILQDSAPPKVKVVGGNFILKGVYSVDDHLSLAKVLRIGIYALLSIQLELNLHRDCHVPLIYPPPPPAILKKPRPRSPSPTKPSSPPPDELETPRNKSFGGGATTSIWNFIAKKTSGIMRPLHIGPTSTHQPAPILPHFPATESLGVRVMADGSKPTPPTPTPLTAHFPGSVGSHHGRTSLDIVRTFSHHLRLTTSDDLVHKHPRPNQAKEDATLMMFSSAVAKITNDQAVLSTSPGIKFPPPSLIRRLAEREASSSTKSKFRLTGDEKAGLTSILGWHDPSEHKNGNGEVPNTGIVIDTGMFIKHQRLTVLYAEHVPAADEPAVKDLLAGNANGSVKSKEKGKEKEGSGGTSEVSGTDSTIRTEESVSGDVVPARSATPPHPKLASSTSSSSSFHIQQQQAIPPSQLPPLPPPTKPTKPCITAHWRTYSYYSQNQLPSSASITPDMSLGKFVETTIGSSVLYLATPKKDEETDEKDEDDDGEDVEVILPACNRPGCGKKRLEHGFNWIHAGVKVTARIEEVDHFPEEEEQADSEDEEIWMWNGCKVCGEKSEKRGMSDGSYLFSFAKYLELLIYSPAMCNVEHNICSHTTSPLARPPNRPKRSASSAKSKKSIPPPISTIPFGTAQSFLLSALPQERFNILRYFYLKSRHSRTQPKGYALVFEVAAVESDIFEVRVPRIQIIKSVVEVKKSDTEARKVRFGTVMGKEPEDGVIDLNDGTRIEDEDEEKKELRGEIEVWWEGIKERLEKLETYISSVSDSRESETTLRRNDPRTKRLPLMPNDDEEDTPAASDEKAKQGEEDENGSSPSTPKATASESGPPPTSSSTTSLPSQTAQAASSRPTSPFPGFPSLPFTLPRPSSPAPQPPPKDIHNKLEVLGSLRELKTSFIQSEQQMYSSLSTTDTQELNDVRRAWVAGARAAKRKLKVWEEKFVGKGWNIVEGVESGELELDEPDWWDKGSYVLPKNRVVIREKDWGSVIAFTLSSPEYRRELENMATGRKFSGAGASLASARSNASKTTAITVPSTPSSISLAISHTGSPSNPSKLSSSTKSVPSTPAQVDDDPFSSPWTLTGYEDIEGMDTEQYSAVVTRKEHPKDVAGILSLRDVLRNQRTVQESPSGATGSTSGGAGVTSTFSSLSSSASKLIRLGMNSGPERDLPDVPPSAWAKPAVELSASPVTGELRVNGRSAVNGMGIGVGEERLGEIMQQLVEQDAAMMSASGSAFSSAASAGSSAFSSVTGSVTSSSKGSAGGSLLAPSSSGGIARASSMLSAVDDVDEGSSGSASMASSVTIQANSATNNTNEQEDVDLDDLDEDEESVDGQSTPPRTRTPTQTTTHSREGSNQTITPPPLPPKDTIYRQKSRNLNSSPPVTPLLRSKGSSIGSTPSASASNTGSITSTIANAMRYVLNPLVGGPETTPSKHHHHALLATHNFHHRNADPAMNAFTPIDDRPHIKYDFTLGKRLKFSCTVYFARQFDMLRKRCGVDGGPDGHGDIVKSLARCVGWEAEGGKSKSSFLKSEDDRFIIKTLVNAWNVADLQVLLELSASYFRYMDQTSSHASVLAKLMGFYTIEIKNLETGQTNGRADLLVMENLFYGFKIEPGRTFDLKGIAGRKVKPVPPPGVKEKEAKAEGSGAEDGKRRKKNRARPAATAVQRPLFDGEWIEGQQKALILVESHSKAILNEAIRGDAEFLAKSNIMDYSLLLGIDQERRQIACGLVDTIGSFTFAKTLEYKAKQGLTGGSGREVTVLPPSEYQERFVNAMQNYFLACPDKWSQTSVAGDDGISDTESPYDVL